ncbi:MAG: Lar family restriction alleviation protein [Acidobacteria bacterium]|nr:Lar family restriction alleviation protein [Acidobacteriota bacterium]
MKHQPGSAQPSLFDFLMDDPFSESATPPKPKPKLEPVTAKAEDPPKPKPKPRAVPPPIQKTPPPEPKEIQSRPAPAPVGRKKPQPEVVVSEPVPAPAETPKKRDPKLTTVPTPKPQLPAIEPQPHPPILEPSSTALPRKACPFCKREVLSLARTTRPAQGIAVECLKCGFRGGVGANEAEAIAKWNQDGLRNQGARLVRTLERSKKKSEVAK